MEIKVLGVSRAWLRESLQEFPVGADQQNHLRMEKPKLPGPASETDQNLVKQSGVTVPQVTDYA